MTLKNAIVTTFAVLSLGSAVANADVVLDWNRIMVATVTGQNPFAQARFAAITQLAVFEAVNAVTGEYTPYLGTISAPPGSSPEAAAVAAAHAVLKNYFPAAAATLDHYEVRLACLDPGRAGEGKRRCSGRGCSGSHDSRPDQRRRGASTVLYAGFVRSRPMATNRQLSLRGRDPVSMAECDSIRGPKLEPVPRRSTARTHQHQVYEELQRGQEGGGVYEHRASSASIRRGDIL